MRAGPRKSLLGFSTFRLIKLAVFSSLCVWREASVERHQTLLKPDDTLRHGGLDPRRMDRSKAHISNFLFLCSFSSFCLDAAAAAAAAAAAVILESACRCRLCGPSATVSAPPLGTSQVWKAQRRRGGLIFHASLHEEKLRERPPKDGLRRLILLLSEWRDTKGRPAP